MATAFERWQLQRLTRTDSFKTRPGMGAYRQPVYYRKREDEDRGTNTPFSSSTDEVASIHDSQSSYRGGIGTAQSQGDLTGLNRGGAKSSEEVAQMTGSLAYLQCATSQEQQQQQEEASAGEVTTAAQGDGDDGFGKCDDADYEMSVGEDDNNADFCAEEEYTMMDAILDAEELEEGEEDYYDEEMMMAGQENETDQAIIEAFLDDDGNAVESMEVCARCQSPLVFSANGDRLMCATASCTSHTFAICDNTVSSLSFGEEAYMFATFNHMNTSKPRKVSKRENDIFGRTTWVIQPALIDYMRLCIQNSLGITDASKITVDDVFACVKIHGWTSLYHEKLIPIFAKITGRPMPSLSEKFRKIANDMFLQARDAYYTKGCKPPSRQNFMDYLYLWYKIYQLIGANHLLCYIRLLDEKNLRKQDEIFEKICSVLNWRFIKTKARRKSVILPLIDHMVDADGNRVVQKLPPGIARVVLEDGTEQLIQTLDTNVTPKKRKPPAAKSNGKQAKVGRPRKNAAPVPSSSDPSDVNDNAADTPSSATGRTRRSAKNPMLYPPSSDDLSTIEAITSSPKHKRISQHQSKSRARDGTLAQRLQHRIMSVTEDDFDAILDAEELN